MANRGDLIWAAARVGGAILAGAVAGTAVWFGFYYLAAPWVAGIGLAIGWVISTLAGLGPWTAGTAWALVAGGIGLTLWLAHRRAPMTPGQAVTFSFIVAMVLVPVMIGFTWASMAWDFGDSGRRLVAHACAALAGLWVAGFLLFPEQLGSLDQYHPPPLDAAGPVEERLRHRLEVANYACISLGAIGCAVAGAYDEGFAGLFGGAIVGGALGTLAGWFLFGAAMAAIAGADREDTPATYPLLGLRVVLQLAFVALVVHDGTWCANWLASTNALNTSYAISTQWKPGEGRPRLQGDLMMSPDRWLLPGMAARPMRWFLAEDVAVNTRAALDLVDMANGGQPTRLKGLGEARVVRAGLKILADMSDVALRGMASGVNRNAQAHLKSVLGNTWMWQAYDWLAKRRARLIQERNSKLPLTR